MPILKKRKYSEYLMWANLIGLPYMKEADQREFLDKLRYQASDNKPKKFDESGFNALRQMLSGNPRFIVK